MSVPNDRGPNPHADPLIAAVLRASAGRAPAPCPEAEVLALYAERELPGDEHGAVEAHVAACARCQAMVAAYLRGAPDQDTAGAVGAVSPAPWWAGWRWLVPLASATAVVAVAVWIGRGPAEQARVADTAPAAAAVPEQNVAPVAPPAAETAAAGGAGAVPARPAPPAATRSVSPVSEPRPQIDARPQSLAVPGQEAVVAERAAAQPARAEAQSTERAKAADRAAAEAPAAAPAAAPALAGRAGNAVGAAAARSAEMTTLTGTVTYRARIAVPAGAVLEVRLLDVSRADAPATTLARAEVTTRGEQVPLPFTLRYDVGAIQPGRRYIVQATITIDGRITWRTTTQHPVLADGAAQTAPIAVVVDAVP